MTERIPDPVAEALAAAGWQPGRRAEDRAREWALRIGGYATPDGRQHTVLPAAIEAYAEFGGLRVPPAGPGEEVAASAVDLDPLRALHSVATLAGLADALGVPLSPLGVENDGAGILAVDRTGRVFLLDHAGDWYLGETVPEALAVLLLGRQPARIAEDGVW
ncbi:SUKH-3 domain-containing protein [Plantactinospora siamensis]|uniref:SUKH-3 domain-containing protein n=1 Tax=Plantactinospora siamensis TaxID=555372 RepID=A0ABV6NQ45_9ACTN